MASALDWLMQQLGDDQASQSSGVQEPMVRQDAQGNWMPYTPPSTGDALQKLQDTLGVTDLTAAKAAFDRGEYPQALGQGVWGAGQLAGAAAPAVGAVGKFAPAVGRALPSLLVDEVGAVRLPRRRPLAPTPELIEPLNTAPPAAGHNMPPPEARFPQYAEEYPPLGEPVPTIFKDTGKPGLEKGWSPEMLAFEAERNRIVKNMQKNGYEPYFDPTQRYHADPANYPSNVDTATIVPAKQATIDKHNAYIDTEEARARLQAGYERGKDMPNTAEWYAMGQLEQKFIDELGEEAGRKAFADRFSASMAATTGGAAPRDNLLMAMYGNYLRTHGLPYPQGAYEMPFPIGGRYATGNMAQHQKIFDAGGFSALGADNPKRHDFSRNFTGHDDMATLDEQMLTGAWPGTKVPASNTYGLYQRVVRGEAEKAGVAPRAFQDIGWGGFKNMKTPGYTSGKPMIEEVNDMIERTHRLTGMSREEIMRRGFIKGEIPMYGLLGAIGLGATAGDGSP